MRTFSLLEPRNLADACRALAEHEVAKPIAGGTSLVIMMKQGFFPPEVLVNLTKIPEAANIGVVDDAVRIGALATMSDIESSDVVRRFLPVLARACHVVANIRIRNVATLGGNLAHADYQSDPPTALLALDASLELRSVRGTRMVPLDDFLLGIYSTALERDELVEAIRVPMASAGQWTYWKFKARSSEDRPAAGVAVGIRSEGTMCTELRVAVGAATARPVRIRSAEVGAVGRPLGEELYEEVADTAASSIDAVEDLNGDALYKRQVVRAIVRRALRACGKEGGA